MPEPALGLPNPFEYGDILGQLKPGVVPWYIQEHLARRAGRHLDVRFGPDKLFSFATRKEMPEPGEKIKLFQTALHEPWYGKWQGTLARGYGAGEVRRKDIGKILVTKVDPAKGQINFTLAHKRFPERFALVRDSRKPKEWYLVNVTPTVPIGFKKLHYTKVPAENIEKLIRPGMSMSAKIDGAAGFVKLLNDTVEVVSYRSQKDKGWPIIHTERMFGGVPRVDIPKEMRGTVLRGEIYGKKGKKIIPAAELGGILNAAIAKSLEKQKTGKIELRMRLFNILESDLPFSRKLEKIREVVEYLPGQFEADIPATDPAAMRKLFESVRAGRHPETAEGVVVTPEIGKPFKAKFYAPHRIWVREVFPQETGELKGKTAGGFRFSWGPSGPVVGEVGTGFTAEEKLDMWRNPQEWVGRLALVRAQEKFPSGALRAPAFVSLHEDYPEATPRARKVAEFLRSRSMSKEAVDIPGFAREYWRELIGSLIGGILGGAATDSGIGGVLGAAAGFGLPYYFRSHKAAEPPGLPEPSGAVADKTAVPAAPMVEQIPWESKAISGYPWSRTEETAGSVIDKTSLLRWLPLMAMRGKAGLLTGGLAWAPDVAMGGYRVGRETGGLLGYGQPKIKFSTGRPGGPGIVYAPMEEQPFDIRHPFIGTAKNIGEDVVASLLPEYALHMVGGVKGLLGYGQPDVDSAGAPVRARSRAGQARKIEVEGRGTDKLKAHVYAPPGRQPWWIRMFY